MSDHDRPRLLAGPLLRYVDEQSATVWVEADRPGDVEVLDHVAPTVTVHGHHYAVVPVDGLEPGTAHPYTVRLAGAQVWPDGGHDELPPSVIHTHPAGGGQPAAGWRIVFGSCRRIQTDVDDPHPDALRMYADRLLAEPQRSLPDLLLMLGDQVYACSVSPRTRAFIEARRGAAGDEPPPRARSVPPAGQVMDFEEFTVLYQEMWASDRSVRWLLSTVPSAMVFDDHDIIDDWNISKSWVDDMRRQGWWHDRVVGGLMAYWLYQHVGNLSPRQLADDAAWQAVLAVDGDAGAELERRASTWDRGASATRGTRWSFARRMGGVRLVVVDSRNGRRLGEGERDMLDEAEWAWLESHAQEDVDHLLIGSSVPILLPRGIHDVEAWNERLCAGAWGARVAVWSERLRQAMDLEHWAAFEQGFDRMCRLVADKADGRSGRPPASLLLLSGDVHCAYTAVVDTGPDQVSAVWQLTSSPFNHVVGDPGKVALWAGVSAVGELIGRLATRAVRVRSPALRWDVVDEPAFGSFLATLTLDGRRAEVLVEQAEPEGFTDFVQRALTGS